jgi:hypothetical protein
MPYINEIVSIINDTLANGTLSDDKRFRKKLYGLSELVPRNYNNAQDNIPTLVDINGGTTFSGMSDIYSIQIYHRCITTNIIDPPVTFGDGGNVSREEANMRMIAFADRNIIKMLPNQLSFILSAGIQQQLQYTQISSYQGLLGVIIEADTTNFDSVAIFTNEYKLPVSSYPLHPNHILISMDYTITTDYDITCISNCPIC